jgi:hypothetical protein
VGFCAVFEHFSGFGLFLLPSRIPARPSAGNANRWAFALPNNIFQEKKHDHKTSKTHRSIKEN